MSMSSMASLQYRSVSQWIFGLIVATFSAIVIFFATSRILGIVLPRPKAGFVGEGNFFFAAKILEYSALITVCILCFIAAFLFFFLRKQNSAFVYGFMSLSILLSGGLLVLYLI